MYLRNACWFLLFCAFWFIRPAFGAEIQVSVDRNPVNLNESFQITFSTSEQPDGSPDFAPLEQDFEILNQQRSSNVSWVNGQSSRTERWIVSVMAKHSGDLIIPPVAFGADSSKPLPIKVTDKPQSAISHDEIFLDVQASPENPYVQSQVLYTLRIYFRVQISQSRLSDLEVKDAVVEQLGEDTTYRTQINGVEYGVLERKYAIFPQQSGLFTIAPLTLTTEVVSGRQPRFNGFFNRQLTETRRIASKAITLNVQSVPQSFTGTAWLSAESLQLREEWSDPSLKVKVGEPLTRTIHLSAKGATVGQIPELAEQTAIDGLKTYPDQPVLNEAKQDDGLVATREEKIAYIPSQAGDYTLPELTITWFNTQTQKTEVAHLPAATLHAVPSGATNTPAQISPKAESPSVSSAINTATPIDAGYWPWIAGCLALGWLTHVAWLLRNKSPKAPPTTPDLNANTSTLSAERRLKQACAKNDPQAAREALLDWAQFQFEVNNLNALAKLCQAPLSDELLELNRYLYAGQTSAWNGDALWRSFSLQKLKTTDSSKSAVSELEPLFKL